MIQWLALVVAADASSKASDAKRRAKKAARAARVGDSDAFVIVKPFALVDDPSAGFWAKFFDTAKKVLDTEPYGSYSVRVADIVKLDQDYDANGKPYVYFHMVEDIRDFKVPGTVEEATKILNGKKR